MHQAEFNRLNRFSEGLCLSCFAPFVWKASSISRGLSVFKGKDFFEANTTYVEIVVSEMSNLIYCISAELKWKFLSCKRPVTWDFAFSLKKLKNLLKVAECSNDFTAL